MPDCLASSHSGNEMKKNNDAGTGPVPDYADAVGIFLVPYQTERMDAGVSFLDADAQLCFTRSQNNMIFECFSGPFSLPTLQLRKLL